ncbi:hypothetical protein IGB42_03978 [Andreprevotia sp. IGB-42]|nr:hypothetical protein IGB42_03978 [Andreprevotia sp. IGB-42]
MAGQGWAVWNVEYRSADVAGGGWPGTYQDVAAAADFTRTLAARYRLDLQRLVFAGHSAGGHLALWAASRDRIADSSVLHAAAPVLPARMSVTLITVADDAVIPASQAAAYRRAARLAGAAVTVRVLPSGGHFAAVATQGAGWQVLLDELAQVRVPR